MENINKKELSKISKEFRQIASRLLQTSYENGKKNTARLILYIENTPFIYEYVKSCCKTKYNFNQIDNFLKEMPIKKEEEVAYVYQLLKHMLDNNIKYYQYATSVYQGAKIQNAVDKFNDSIVKPFVNHIETHISNSYDELHDNEKREDENINIQTVGQFNYAKDQASIIASNVVNNSASELLPLIDKFLSFMQEEKISEDNKEEIKDLLETIKEQKDNPKKGLLKIASEKITNLYQIVDKGGKLAIIISQLLAALQSIIG